MGRNKVKIYYTYHELKGTVGIPLFVKFVTANSEKLICLEIDEEVSKDKEKLEKIEEILSNLYFIDLKRIEEDFIEDIE